MANADRADRGANPLLVHALRQFSRSRRKLGRHPVGQAIILASAAAAYVLTLVSWLAATRGDRSGGAMVTIAMGLLAALLIALPGVGAGVFGQERQKGTLDLLLTCPLSNREIIRGKLLGLLLGPLAVCGLALPFVLAVSGVHAETALNWFAMALLVPTTVAGLACLGLYCSVSLRNTGAARAAATLVALGLGYLLPTLEFSFMQLGGHHGKPIFGPIVSPLWAYVGIVDEGSRTDLAFLCPLLWATLAVLLYLAIERRFDRCVRGLGPEPRAKLAKPRPEKETADA